MLFELNSRKFAGNRHLGEYRELYGSGEEEINAIDFAFMKKYLFSMIVKFPAGM
jgi:hypothetical protein